ncbi:hypothetical protein ADUPG1_001974, partial [Aduncisulcus paluster]
MRTIPKGEEAGLFNRVDHESGRRHGSIITLYKERCDFFLSLYKQEYGLLLDTDHDRYQTQGVTNADRHTFSRLSDQGKRVFGVISSVADHTEQDEISLVIQSIARDAACSEITARRVIKHGHEA